MLFILVEIQKEALKNKSLINFDNVKNQHIEKYANTILDLRKMVQEVYQLLIISMKSIE